MIEYNQEIDSVNRADIAEIVSQCMGRRLSDNIPYMPNEGDDSFWTVDSGNDWKVKFFPDDLKKMEIIHRYSDNNAVNGLSLWVAYRTGGKVS